MLSPFRFLHSLGALLTVATVSLRAFDLQTDESGVYTVKWHQSPVALDIRLPNTTALSDGRTAAISVRDAATTWNDQIEVLRFTTTVGSVTPRVAGNGRNELVIENTINGSDFGTGVLAVTLIHHNGNQVLETDIIFNADENWDSYAGSLRSRPDLHRVALHELGHVLGLDHPDEAGQFVTAIMNSRMSAIDALQSDDIAGGQQLYGAPGVVPANNDFQSAISVGTGYSYFSRSTNVNADREPGEPAHAGVPFGHSVWWRWTSDADQLVHVDTDGSDFDTVLAVYSGTSLNALTEIAANDDEETPEQNPNPDRRRTSKLTFNSVAGTTYYFAVDGWGDAERFPAGSTGAITFNLRRGPLQNAPVMTKQPQPASASVGTYTRFTVSAVSSVYPLAFQWERRPAGGSDWESLSYSDHYSGTNISTLEVRAITLAMNGDRFRCRVSNQFGEVISDEAVLSVTAGPLPSIENSPQSANPPAGSVVRLAVEAHYSESYQWYRDDVPIPGATNTFLWVDVDSKPGRYRVVLANSDGETTSDDAVIAARSAPTVTNLGASPRRVVSPGETVLLQSSATGEGPLSYQWMHNGRPVPGATGSQLTFSNVSRIHTGAYWLRVTDRNDTRHGDPFFVVVAPPAARVQTWGDSGQAETLPRPDFTDAVATTNSSRAAISRTGRVVSWPGPFTSAPNGGGRDIVDLNWADGGELTLLADGTIRSLDPIADAPVEALRRVVRIASTGTAHFALLTNGTVVAWPDSRRADPMPDTSGLSDIIAIDACANTAAALDSEGHVTILTTTEFSKIVNPPVTFPNGVALAVGFEHLLVLRSDGTLTSWGDNGFGQSVMPEGLDNVVAIDASEWSSLALRSDGTVAAWGNNEFGQTSVPSLLGPAFGIALDLDSALALVEVEAVPSRGSRIVNLSVRSNSGADTAKLVMGFAIRGDYSLPVLIRAAGPTIAQFGVEGALPDPVLQLFGDTHVIAFNDDWDSNSTALIATTSEVGAFSFLPDSRDAALLAELPARSYSLHLSSKDATTGIGLAEVYDTLQIGEERLSNVSARSEVGTGNNILTAGLVIVGDSPLNVVMRGIGPGLVPYGIPESDILKNPIMKIFQGNQLIATNDNWAGGAALKSAFNTVGAFPLASDESFDAAVLLTLDPGLYTIQISGADGGTGVALVEIYDVP